MKILFINHYTVGTSLYYRDIGFGKILAERGHTVTIIIRRNEAKQINSEEIGNINVVYWIEPFNWLTPINLLLVLKHSFHANVIHLERANPISSTLAFIAKLLFRVPIIEDLTDWDGVGGWASMVKKGFILKILMTFYEEIVPRMSDAVVVVSRTLYERVSAMGVPENRIFYIPNGVDETFFKNECEEDISIKSKFGLFKKPVIIYIGVLYQHDYHIWKTLIYTMNYIVEILPDAVLLIVGWGDAITTMKEMAANLGLEKNIVLTGGVPHHELYKYLKVADVALNIMPTNHLYYHSCSPKALGEYMIAGKAIVATNIGEVREALKDETGILINSDNPMEYGKAIVNLLKNPELKKKIGDSARKKALENYSNDVLARRLEKAYAMVTRRH